MDSRLFCCDVVLMQCNENVACDGITRFTSFEAVAVAVAMQ